MWCPPASCHWPSRAARLRVPRSQQLRRKRFAPPTRPGRPRAPLVAPLSHTASHPRVWSGECSRGLGSVGPGYLATDPHSGSIWDSLPSHGRSAARAFGASRSAASVSRPFSGPWPMPSVHSPLCTYESALCSQRVACLQNRLARVLHGLTPSGPSSPPNRTDSSRLVSSLCQHRARPAPARPCRATQAVAGPRPGRRRAGRFVQLRKERYRSSRSKGP